MARSACVTYLVSATRERAAYFSRATLLGRSLLQFPAALRPRLFLKAENHGSQLEGLSAFYNRAIAALPHEGYVVFIHDDVYIHDWFLTERLREAFLSYDLVGLVGSVQPTADQPSATHTLGLDLQPKRTRDCGESGAINHFDPQRIVPDVYGETPQQCGLLDGCFLACRLEKLHQANLRFDPRFGFHCYDADFCRSAQAAGFSLGTWPIACTHGSPGNFGAGWRESALRFRDKWCAST